MVQAILLHLCFLFFGITIGAFAGELNNEYNHQGVIRKLLSLQPKFSHQLPIQPFESSSPPTLRRLSSQLQWLNFKMYDSLNCKGDIVSYISSSNDGCIQNGTSSYYVSASTLTDVELILTKSSYSNTQCSGTPSNVVTMTEPSCTNSNGTSLQIYSITNSIPPLPGGTFFRLHICCSIVFISVIIYYYFS